MEKLNRFFGKYATLFFLTIFIPTCLLLPDSEFMLAVILGAIGLIGIFGPFDKPKSNRIPGIISLFVSIFFALHLYNLEYEVELIPHSVNVVDLEFEYFVYIEDLEKTYTIDKSHISFDRDNPLMSFKIYKADIFGERRLEKIGFRSAKMDEYFIPINR